MSLSYPADEFSTVPARRRRRRGRASPLVPLLVGTALAVVTLASQSKLGAWLRGFLAAPGTRPDRDDLAARMVDVPLPALRSSIMGRRKAFVAAAYGPPRTAVATRGVVPVANQGAFWQADTWYYPVDPRTQTAMAVKFVRDVAREVEFFDTPAGPAA